MKGVGRSIHTVYHFEGELALGEITRFTNFGRLVAYYQPQEGKSHQIIATQSQQQAFAELLARFDKSFLSAKKFDDFKQTLHAENVNQLSSVMNRTSLNLELTDEEVNYWSSDVPDQMSGKSLMPIWKQAAFASKLLTSRQVRTVSLEFDYSDIHGIRSKDAMDTMAKQTVLPLDRLIKALKEDGIWDQTVILINTLDGSRTPNADSFGNTGKNGFILAGGSIKGGYYGDIKHIRSSSGGGNVYAYHVPDLATGVAVPNGVEDNSNRVPDQVAYTTILKAIGISSDFIKDLPNTDISNTMDFLFKS